MNISVDLILVYCLGKYRYLHEGHCAGSGYTPPNTNQATIDDCLKECKTRNDVKYFAYVPGRQCACYKTECLSDGGHMDHKAYEIVEDGNSGRNCI